ncbi:MAG: 4Fe-4S binding protein [Candidatus Geothermincolia bacterium]
MKDKKKQRVEEQIGFITTLSVPMEGSVGKTGSWRIFKPVKDAGRCNQCLQCWIFCPEACMTKDIEIDYDYCKGCGICATECVRNAIVMVKEERP